MFKNEKGAVLPVTMVVAAVLIMFTFYSIEKFNLEKMFYKNVEDGLVLDHILLLASHEVQNMVAHDDQIDEGVLHFPNGTVEYVVISREERYISLILSALTKQGLSRKVNFLYDKEEGKLVKWGEVFT
ncbi:competence type IV pilus minor pilin ComGG [Peribacillus loiseleuriae]|uniref:competence type IV pilus minor pilin ComGG n=1 Tax=Peribacillus loiseleuriae TaxID=1679170 RepID=UPI003D052675